MATSTMVIPAGTELRINGKLYSGSVTVDTTCPGSVPVDANTISPAMADHVRGTVSTHSVTASSKNKRDQSSW